MRILVLSNLPPYVMGGAEIQVARLIRCWKAHGHTIEVAGNRIPSGTTRMGDQRFRIFRIRTIFSLGRFMRGISFFISALLLLFLRRKKTDIIYCRGLSDGAITVCVAKALRIIRCPLLACPINARGKGDIHFIKTIPGWRWIIRLIDRHCNAMNIIAPAIFEDLKRVPIVHPEIAFIPNGIPIHPLPEPKRCELPVKLVFTGRLSFQKGLDLLMEALASLKEEGFEFQLDIIGDGPERETLNRLIQRKGLKTDVRILGKSVPEEIAGRLEQYGAFILPSRWEGMSNSALEAMERGLPPLVTRCGGIDCYIQPDSGWVCNPGDVESLMNSLRSLLETQRDVLYKMGRQARKAVEKNFDMMQVAEKNIMLMERLIS